MTGMHRVVSSWLVAASMLGLASFAHAVTVSESFTGASTGPGWTLSGSATLTGTGAPDPVGAGWLRLTPASGGQGYAYNSQVLPITQRITVSFEFADWGGTGADGLTFFLFNAAEGFSTGNGGGGFGYEAMPTGVLAVGVADGYPSSFTNGTSNAIAVRGPGPGTAFIGGTGGLSPTPETPARGLTPADPNYRRLTITLNPAGAGAMAVSVQLQTGTTVSTVLSNVVVSGLPPNVQFGLSAATGGQTNNHEVRNFSLASGTPVIPTLSQWSLVILATALLLGSLVVLARRRRESRAR